MPVLILGSFNPPTVAHVAMSVRLHEAYPEASVCYIPANERYLAEWKEMRGGAVMPMELRARLLEEAIDPAYASVSCIEAQADKTDGKTWNTARYFQKTTGEEIVLAIGADNLPKLHLWYKGRELAEHFRFAVFCRGGEIAESEALLPQELEDLREHFCFLSFDHAAVSASRVREAYLNGTLEEVRAYLPENVYRYLCENEGVYRKENESVWRQHGCLRKGRS